MLRVLAVSGSLRTESYNRKALQIAKKIAVDLGAEVNEIDLRELDLPIYDGDIQTKGLPDSVQKLKAEIKTSDVLLIASPEYNYGISGALKNAIDWASREGNSLDGKAAAIFGASDGIFGTLRGQFQLRQVLTALNVFILPQPHVFIRNANEAFNPNGSFRDQETRDRLEKLIRLTFEFAKKLKI